MTHEHRVDAGEDVAGVASKAALRRDLALIERWQRGDAPAGIELLDHYAGFVRRTMRAQGLRHDSEVDELWQELVLRLMQQLPALTERVRSSFAGYLAWQVRDLMRSWRRQHRSPTLPEPVEPAIEQDPTPRLAFWEALQGCAAKLPDRERLVFQHRFERGLDLGEVAAQVGSNANAVAQAVFRLIRRLRACLAASGYESPGDLQ